MTDFEIIPDAERPTPSPRRSGVLGSFAESLISGKTVFVAGVDRRPNSRIGTVTLRTRGLRLCIRKTVRNGVEGYIAWAEPWDEP